MIRKSRVALALAAMSVAPVAAFAAPPAELSLVDRFIAGEACRLHASDPNLVWLETVGSVDGIRREKLTDELLVVLATLQDMMSETHSTREDILELRITTTSDAYKRDVAQAIARTPELAGIPFTYRVVDGFDVKWARVGADAVLRNPKANAAVTTKHASGFGPDCRA